MLLNKMIPWIWNDKTDLLSKLDSDGYDLMLAIMCDISFWAQAQLSYLSRLRRVYYSQSF